jgi:hypothetical protein
VTFFILATVQSTSTPPQPEYDSRRLWLESWDGSVVMPVPMDNLPHEMIAQRGILGLGVAPTDLATEGTPGVAGSRVVDVIERDRPIALPLAFIADTQVDLWATIQQLRDLTDPTRDMTADGNFRLVCASSSGTRQLNLAYRSGLEGDDLEYYGTDRAVLDLLAALPYAQDREDQWRDFRLAVDPMPFLSPPGTDNPWGTLQLAPSSIAGADTPVEMFSSVPVYPVIEITGPADSVLIEGENGLRIDVPTGVLAGQTLRIVTDPRHKSIRLDGALAAGKLARGSRLRPFSRGTTLVDVTAPGADSDTLLRLTWRGLHRSPW